MDTLAGPSRREPRALSELWILYLAAAVGIAVGLAVKVQLASWNTSGVRSCVRLGTNPAYCRNIEDYPSVLQWAYAVLAGWCAFFVVWAAYTLQPHLWRRVL